MALPELNKTEFAPGIPKERITHSLGGASVGRPWVMVVQEHHAHHAGKHWDLRLIDPTTLYAHSWAIPKSRLPDAGEKLLAVRTPTHTAHYSLNFGANGPQQISHGYGKGSVEIVNKDLVLVEKVTDETVKFKRLSNNQSYTMFRTHNDKWLMQQGNAMEKSAYELGYRQALLKLGLDTATLQESRQDTQAVQGLVGALDKMTQEDPAQIDRDQHNADGPTASERRLNQPVTWSAPMSDTNYGFGEPYNTLRGRSYG